MQTNVWGRYHITDPGDFYQRSDAWNVAQNPPKEQESRTAAPVADRDRRHAGEHQGERGYRRTTR